MDNCEIDEKCLIEFIQVLENNPTITSFEIIHIPLTLESALAIAKVLKVNNTLKTLILNNNILISESALAIASSLENNNTLNYLDLQFNTNLSLEVQETVLSLLEQNRSLMLMSVFSYNLETESHRERLEARASALTKRNEMLQFLDEHIAESFYPDYPIENSLKYMFKNVMRNLLSDNSTIENQTPSETETNELSGETNSEEANIEDWIALFKTMHPDHEFDRKSIQDYLSGTEKFTKQYMKGALELFKGKAKQATEDTLDQECYDLFMKIVDAYQSLATPIKFIRYLRLKATAAYYSWDNLHSGKFEERVTSLQSIYHITQKNQDHPLPERILSILAQIYLNEAMLRKNDLSNDDPRNKEKSKEIEHLCVMSYTFANHGLSKDETLSTIGDALGMLSNLCFTDETQEAMLRKFYQTNRSKFQEIAQQYYEVCKSFSLTPLPLFEAIITAKTNESPLSLDAGDSKRTNEELFTEQSKAGTNAAEKSLGSLNSLDALDALELESVQDGGRQDKPQNKPIVTQYNDFVAETASNATPAAQQQPVANTSTTQTDIRPKNLNSPANAI